MAGDIASDELLPLVSDIVAAHVSNNKVPIADLPQLVGAVHDALVGLVVGAIPAVRPEPQVPVKRSVTSDFIVCLEDGRKLKMLKRHLRSDHKMSPEDYRKRWGLSADYPMVAPNYAKIRSKLAKAIGPGTRPRRRKAQPLATKGLNHSKRVARK